MSEYIFALSPSTRAWLVGLFITFLTAAADAGIDQIQHGFLPQTKADWTKLALKAGIAGYFAARMFMAPSPKPAASAMAPLGLMTAVVVPQEKRSIFSSIFHFLGSCISVLLKPFKGKEAQILEASIVPILRIINGEDVFGDRVKLVAEISGILHRLNLPWLDEAMVDIHDLTSMNHWDFKVWLGAARLAAEFAEKYGADRLPAAHIIRALVGAAYSTFVRDGGANVTE